MYSIKEHEEIDNLLKRYNIYKLDNITVSMYNKEFNFSYTIADAIVKEEFKGKYTYIGGLQCNYEVDSNLYRLLEEKLCSVAKSILLIS